MTQDRIWLHVPKPIRTLQDLLSVGESLFQRTLWWTFAFMPIKKVLPIFQLIPDCRTLKSRTTDLSHSQLRCPRLGWGLRGLNILSCRKESRNSSFCLWLSMSMCNTVLEASRVQITQVGVHLSLGLLTWLYNEFKRRVALHGFFEAQIMHVAAQRCLGVQTTHVAEHRFLSFKSRNVAVQ